ncbi:MAG: hypothetical protein JW900_07135, partial [Anaerolineae bacterium]|nr:hypothetical protein [Anaerolineae bacterium]
MEDTAISKAARLGKITHLLYRNPRGLTTQEMARHTPVSPVTIRVEDTVSGRHFPHARGGGSEEGQAGAWRSQFSPRAWGWTDGGALDPRAG